MITSDVVSYFTATAQIAATLLGLGLTAYVFGLGVVLQQSGATLHEDGDTTLHGALSGTAHTGGIKPIGRSHQPGAAHDSHGPDRPWQVEPAHVNRLFRSVIAGAGQRLITFSFLEALVIYTGIIAFSLLIVAQDGKPGPSLSLLVTVWCGGLLVAMRYGQLTHSEFRPHSPRRGGQAKMLRLIAWAGILAAGVYMLLTYYVGMCGPVTDGMCAAWSVLPGRQMLASQIPLMQVLCPLMVIFGVLWSALDLLWFATSSQMHGRLRHGLQEFVGQGHYESLGRAVQEHLWANLPGTPVLLDLWNDGAPPESYVDVSLATYNRHYDRVVSAMLAARDPTEEWMSAAPQVAAWVLDVQKIIGGGPEQATEVVAA